MTLSANDSNVVLNITSRMAFLPVVTSFVEQTAKAMTLGKNEALALTLAAEEIFTYLCRLTTSICNLKIYCADMGYGVRTDFVFAAANFCLRAFNLTATVAVDDAASLDEMGLLIASRSVDWFDFFEDQDHTLHLSLIKEKRYPEVKPEAVLPVLPSTQFEIVRADSDNLKVFASRVLRYYPEILTPTVCRYPGKLVDMVSSGSMSAALALDSSKTAEVEGGILWAPFNQHTIECFGPFVFNHPAPNAISEALLDTCMGDIAHTPSVALINRFPTPELPPGYFESLGTLDIRSSGAVTTMPVYFRQLKEDPGARVWGHVDIEAFLHREYDRLSLPRHITMFQDVGEMQNSDSVLSTTFDRIRGQITLRPVCSGTDMTRNIKQHIQLLQKESVVEIFLEIDTGISWQLSFVPGILQSGFVPKMLIPYGGSADLIIFQWESASS